MKLKKLFGVLLLVFCGVYLGFSFHYYDHFYDGTIIWGQDCSRLTVEEAKVLVDRAIETYQIELEERQDKKETLTAKELGINLLNDGSIETMLDQQKPYLWIQMLWRTFDFAKEVNLNISEDVFDNALQSLEALKEENTIAPVNAYQKYDKETKKYIIVPEDEGATLDQSALKEAVYQAVLEKKTVFNLDENNCYVEPEVREDNEELVELVNNYNVYMETRIEYDFGDRTEVVDGDRIHKWLKVGKENKVSLDESKVKDFVDMLVDKYSTVGTKRTFKTLSGKKVTVSGGTYGWTIDGEKEYKKLLSLIKKHKQTERKPVYSQTAWSRNKNDIGNTYIEIDLSKQHLWYYVKGKTLVSTSVVTGDVTKGRGTPTGVYYILYKQTDHVLRGTGYASHVDYWMPYMGDRGIGIHDASWRSSYGGSIYRGNGSHGCVNTPWSAVRQIFNNVESGCPVVVHW